MEVLTFASLQRTMRLKPMYSHGMTGQSSSRGTCVRPNTYLRDGGHEQCHTMTGEHYSAPHCMQQVHVMSHPALPCPALPCPAPTHCLITKGCDSRF